jgi:uncharacterized protein YwgA
MSPYQLAKLVEWAGTLVSRKRMQKVIYLLQVAGWRLEAEYTLHQYGPYSHEVARLTDEMVRASLLDEQAASSVQGVQYTYRLTDPSRQQLDAIERTPESLDWLAEMAPFEIKAKALLEADLEDLEIASTLVFFERQSQDWAQATEKTRQFKNLPPGSPLLERALVLAKQIVY